jgi:hypothetical protein
MLPYQIADHVETTLVELCVECVVGRHVNGDAVRIGPSSKTLLKYLAVHKITDILKGLSHEIDLKNFDKNLQNLT